MIDDPRGEEEETSSRERGVSQEEQGDLLADAVTGFFSLRPEDSDSDDSDSEGTDSEGADSEEREAGGGGEGALGSGSPPQPGDSRTPAGDSKAPEARGVTEKDGSAEEIGENSGDGATIPTSLWEQRMAWAKARAKEGRLEEAEELYRELLERGGG